MSEEELRKNDILFQIDMQLYDEFNDKLCEMDEHLGDIYSLRDIEEVKQAEKEKERELLIEAIKKLQKENEELKRKTYKAFINDKGEVQFVFDNYISKDKIRTKIKELEKNIDLQWVTPIYNERVSTTNNTIEVYKYQYATEVLEELLGETKDEE